MRPVGSVNQRLPSAPVAIKPGTTEAGRTEGAGLAVGTDAAQRVGMADNDPKIAVGTDGEAQRRPLGWQRIFGEVARGSQAPDAACGELGEP